MSKLLRHIGISFVLAAGLVGCAAHSPAPVSSLKKDYSSVERGSYRGSYYEVKKGDTLYFIAYVTDKDVNDLVRYNELSQPYTIYPGQKLKLWAPKYVAPKYGQKVEPVVVPVVTTAPPPVVKPTTTTKPVTSSKNSSQKPTTTPTKVAQKEPPKKVEQTKAKEYVGSKDNQPTKPKPPTTTVQNDKVSKWLWPTKGRVIKSFSAGEQGNKGIDIAGQRGQPIVSTAAGTVVYSGNALRGYGNLIIVKHNDNYLSAYAHNDKLLVTEGQSVKSGQKIATMGSSGAKSVKLHFEIRYQGKSVNPKRYLP
ncbi:peptidoglycan DD-metalloendopeptidase family protein [Vibrio parahaemolyticus]|uniref:peptidoglycan DD-metalloendopeptidase family protein n=1 Tax=Vibrio parahaemolyticus TaxID=670 RepID=UPI000448FA10|nr:peptidoglycan DD-metalloendopeptidase family protein [Vibrio parahaemolyticus]EGQ7830283.1 peptidoglycan DD-metalloendopeptidase family protein [Vibrio parahaemolyticus]EGQ9828280.1 peptidoglycan DD-metalloendopeptidase family protein [Vibrio parahaemolyticus]EGR0256663.1 peptidoglycan DD-metalloendopeptidase family protein [Vibrio parahaemolyticus]EHH1253419.1 peptidoglycan DD-metalloendopeptidase family protein [Vibrio parahaemolyticus]EHR6658532.1 peptidoglycan DD-metalloendopeptidase fa